MEADFDPVAARRRRWLWLSTSALLFVALGFSARPGYRALKTWRAARLAAEAEPLQAAQRWPEALAKIQAAYQLAPQEPSVIRTLARFHSATGQPGRAIPHWQNLRILQAAQPADLRQLAEDFLRSGALPEAQAEIQRLLATDPADPATLRLAAQWSAVAREWEPALAFARRARDLAPADPAGALLLASLQLNATTPAIREEGAQELLRLGAAGGPTALEALQNLGTKRDLPAPVLAAAADLLRQHPEATDAHRLLALEIEVHLRPAETDALLDAAVARYQTAEPAAQRAFGVWLNARQDPRRALQVLPLDTAFRRKDLLLVHLDALAALKQWPEIERILTRKQIPLDEVYTELFLARASMELGRGSETELHWRRAQLAAAASPEQMMFLGQYAEKIGDLHQAGLAYRELTTNATTARPAYAALLRLAEKKGATEPLRALLGEMKSRWPTDAAVLNDYAYLSLLLAQDVPACRALATQLVTKAPGSLPHRTTLALAALRENDAAAALAVYYGLEIPWAQVAAGPRAVHAAVLGAAGKTADARTAADALPLADLRPEERALIQPWRTP